MEAGGNGGRKEFAGVLGFAERAGECCGKMSLEKTFTGPRGSQITESSAGSV